MHISAKIAGLKYKPLLCRKLKVVKFDDIHTQFHENASFLLEINCCNSIAVSWWVSPKRTRSYPYVRVYDTLHFSGKKLTVIPLVKDEGARGDRDFIQWDTIALMSLLGVYVIIAYYHSADKSQKYENKITNQKFDMDYLFAEIQALDNFQSDALHWNLKQIDKIDNIADRAVASYESISASLNIKTHSIPEMKKKLKRLRASRDEFLSHSRNQARSAQRREEVTVQPKENLTGTKGAITIKNFLGGHYYFTCDEVQIQGKNVYLIEGKHTDRGTLPSESDIKDGLLKMYLYANLSEVSIGNALYNPIAALKLTTKAGFNKSALSPAESVLFELLMKDAAQNRYQILTG